MVEKLPHQIPSKDNYYLLKLKSRFMQSEKFTLSPRTIGTILGFIEGGEYVIPEIQRPFVWKKTQVRDLIDSLYRGYPTGYIITCRNPDIRTKDGGISSGKQILIDGQQRITALMAALCGKEVLDEDFNVTRIKIAFNPQETDPSKKFEVQDASHLNDPKWITDISEIFADNFDSYGYVTDYSKRNGDYPAGKINAAIQSLFEIKNRNIGQIELNNDLDIDEITDIFIRINSKGTVLNQVDFVMSKMAANKEYGGESMRKAIDYYCHLAAKPEFVNSVVKDLEFTESEYWQPMKWLGSDFETIYDPTYDDVIRVSYLLEFSEGRMKNLVARLSGRDFKTKEYREDIITDTYDRMKSGILDYFNEYNFKQFIIAIKSAGFITERQLTSRMTVDFAYLLYLKLHRDTSMSSNEQIKRHVQKWFVLSTLTGRYVSSPESAMDKDIRSINEKGFVTFMEEVEASELSDAFWDNKLPSNLERSIATSPAFNVFLAAQIRMNCSSMLMDGVRISDLITISGDIHHIFPKEYLKKNGFDSRGMYNQLANYTYLDTQVNKNIGMDAPRDYFGKVLEQCKGSKMELGNICDINAFKENLRQNCIPESIIDMDSSDYETFLTERRKLMSNMIRDYYNHL